MPIRPGVSPSGTRLRARFGVSPWAYGPVGAPPAADGDPRHRLVVPTTYMAAMRWPVGDAPMRSHCRDGHCDPQAVADLENGSFRSSQGRLRDLQRHPRRRAPRAAAPSAAASASTSEAEAKGASPRERTACRLAPDLRCGRGAAHNTVPAASRPRIVAAPPTTAKIRLLSVLRATPPGQRRAALPRSGFPCLHLQVHTGQPGLRI